MVVVLCLWEAAATETFDAALFEHERKTMFVIRQGQRFLAIFTFHPFQNAVVKRSERPILSQNSNIKNRVLEW